MYIRSFGEEKILEFQAYHSGLQYLTNNLANLLKRTVEADQMLGHCSSTCGQVVKAWQSYTWSPDYHQQKFNYNRSLESLVILSRATNLLYFCSYNVFRRKTELTDQSIAAGVLTRYNESNIKIMTDDLEISLNPEITSIGDSDWPNAWSSAILWRASVAVVPILSTSRISAFPVTLLDVKLAMLKDGHNERYNAVMSTANNGFH